MLGLYGRIKFISRFYVGDRTGKYFIFVSNLKLIKTILKLQDKFRKEDGNDMAANVAQWKCSNIKCYTSAFSNILTRKKFRD